MATAFDLGGLLGSAFGGTGALDDLLTPEQRAAIRQQGALSAAAALLQAAGPSATPSSLGQALGSAFAAGQAGMQRGQESALAQMLTRQRLDEARRNQTLQANIARILTGGAEAPAAGAAGTVTPEEALAAPGMAAGPTVERAGLIGQPRPQAPAPQLSQNEIRARQYRQIADVYAASGRGEEATRFMDIAEKLAPTRPEIVGEPIKTQSGYVMRTKSGTFIPMPKEYEPAAKPVGDPQLVTERASGREVLVQRYDDGSYQTVEQFGPPRKIERIDTGGGIQFVDMSAVRPGTTIAKTLAPQVVGGAESGYFVIGGGGGGRAAAPGAAPAAAAPRAPAAGAAPGAAPTAAPAPAPAAGPQPIIPGTGQRPPEAFMKAARQLNDLRGSIDDYKQTLKGTNWVLPKNIPIPFTEGGISLPTGSDTAAVSSRYNALLMGVKNLYELGALTGPDLSIIERQITNPASWAGLLTSKNAMNEQVKVLEDMLDRAEKNLETSYRQKIPQAAPVQSQPVAAPTMREGAISADRAGRPIVYRNGQWVYQ